MTSVSLSEQGRVHCLTDATRTLPDSGWYLKTDGGIDKVLMPLAVGRYRVARTFPV